MINIMAALAMTLALGGTVAAAAQLQQPATPAPHRIFFDWGKAVVSQDSAATLDDVAAVLLQRVSEPVSIVGHSDRSGPAGANRHAALLRAEAVRDYLVRRGVPAGLLQISARGEDVPLVPTADGVREPHNRRVDVDFARSAGR